jgi:hypothetical protein
MLLLNRHSFRLSNKIEQISFDPPPPNGRMTNSKEIKGGKSAMTLWVHGMSLSNCWALSFDTLHKPEEERLKMHGWAAWAFCKLHVAPELSGRLMRCKSHCVCDGNDLIMLELLSAVLGMTVGVMLAASVKLHIFRALHNPNAGLTSTFMMQWASKQSNKSRSLLLLVLAILFPQRHIGWL